VPKLNSHVSAILTTLYRYSGGKTRSGFSILPIYSQRSILFLPLFESIHCPALRLTPTFQPIFECQDKRLDTPLIFKHSFGHFVCKITLLRVDVGVSWSICCGSRLFKCAVGVNSDMPTVYESVHAKSDAYMHTKKLPYRPACIHSYSI